MGILQSACPQKAFYKKAFSAFNSFLLVFISHQIIGWLCPEIWGVDIWGVSGHLGLINYSADLRKSGI